MQYSQFHNGSFVLHNVRGNFMGKCSAWFDQTGKLVAAEQVVNGQCRGVKVNGPIWEYLQKKGRIHKVA